MGDAIRVFLAVARARRLRRIAASYAVFSVAENATWLAIIVYAFGRGGVTEAGLISFVQLAPTAALAPLAAYAGDRFRRDRVLAAGFAVQAVTMVATAAAMGAGGGPVVVYGSATLAAISVSFTRPAVGSILPGLTDSPADLTAANVMIGLINELGGFAGPLVAVVLFAVGSPATVFAVCGVAVGVAALSVVVLRVDQERLQPPHPIDAGDVWTETLGGFTVLRRERDVRLLVVVFTSGALFLGGSDVLFVAVASEVLSDDSSRGAGLLNAAFGVGAILGGAASVGLVGRRGLARFVLGGVIAMTLSVAAVAGAVAIGPALALFVVFGAGKSAAAIAGATLVQRIAPSRVLARVFGVVEGADMLAIGLGGLALAALVDAIDLRWASLVFAAVVAAPIAARARRLLALEDRIPEVRPELLTLLRSEPIFGVLPAPALERLLSGVSEVRRPAGATILREGDVGDRFYLVESGRLRVTVAGIPTRDLGRGSSFGEIALLRDVPRTATVTATTDVVLQSVGRDDFLEAVTGHPQSWAQADDAAARYVDP